VLGQAVVQIDPGGKHISNTIGARAVSHQETDAIPEGTHVA
jgi:hypothetical protein